MKLDKRWLNFLKNEDKRDKFICIMTLVCMIPALCIATFFVNSLFNLWDMISFL